MPLPSGAWLTNSNVLHSVADSIEGPYVPHDIALGPRSANYWDGEQLSRQARHCRKCFEPSSPGHAHLAPPLTPCPGITQHNPDIQRAADGTYLLFYMGSTANGTSHQNCTLAGTDGDHHAGGLPPITQNQRIGIATATSPYGPWTRPDAPVSSGRVVWLPGAKSRHRI
jgi:hypothetical protein